MKAETLQRKLPKLEDYNGNMVEVPSWIWGGVIHVSTEHDVYTGDYYGEFGQGYPTINQKLEDWAEKHGMFWEWYNPGSIALYKW